MRFLSKHSFLQFIFQILYFSTKIYKVQKMKKVFVSTFTAPKWCITQIY